MCYLHVEDERRRIDQDQVLIFFLQASVLTTSPETRSPPSIRPFDDDIISCIQPTVGIEGGA